MHRVCSAGANYITIPGVYQYSRVIGLDVSSKTSIVVSIKMSNDFHVGLTNYQDTYTLNTMYEIPIGGWSNTASVIR